MPENHFSGSPHHYSYTDNDYIYQKLYRCIHSPFDWLSSHFVHYLDWLSLNPNWLNHCIRYHDRTHYSSFQLMKPIIPFTATLTGVIILFTPVDWWFKILISSLTALPGCSYLISERSHLDKAISELEKVKQESESIARSNASLIIEIQSLEAAANAKFKEAELAKTQAENEVNRIKSLAQIEAEQAITDAAEIEGQARRDAISVIEEAELEKQQLLSDARRTLNAITGEIAAIRSKAAHSIWRARRKARRRCEVMSRELHEAIAYDSKQMQLKQAELETELNQKQAEVENALASQLKEMQQQRNELEEELKTKSTEAESKIAQLWADFEQEKEAVEEAFANQLLAENEATLQQQLDQYNQEFIAKQKEYDDAIALAEKQLKQQEKELTKQWEEKYNQWLIPHIQEYQTLKEALEDWKQRYYAAEEEIASLKDIELPDNPWRSLHTTRAVAVQQYLKSQGVLVNYYNSAIDKNGTFTLYFKPWQSGAKFKRSLEGALPGMQSNFGLIQPPVFGEQVDCWFLEMAPAVDSLVNSVESAYKLEASFPASPAVLTVPQTVENTEALQSLDYEQKVQFMMNLRPGTLPKPVTEEISQNELTTADWFCNWRFTATRGEQANIRGINKLIEALYGIKPGRSTEVRDPVTKESLRQRVHRILKLLKIEDNRFD
ncbi:MAG: hypothetical protein F6K14_11580 [Symploca sp. SIO2C1]|nr:hypothetical protein [Symploca sp. SIO2C1]